DPYNLDLLNKTLEQCERYVLKKTEYQIKLANKSMDENLSFILPAYSKYVQSDYECQQKLFKIEGPDKFKYCKGQLYIFDERTGQFGTAIEILFYYLIKNKEFFDIILSSNSKTGELKLDNYGTSARLQKDVIPFIKTAALDDEWLHYTANSSLGYLLFKDGIYNMKKSEFTYGFDPTIVFHSRIPWNYPDRDSDTADKDIAIANRIAFDALFEDSKVMIYALARALAGDITIKKFYFCPGELNAGKSMFGEMLRLAFGSYVGFFNAEQLAFSSKLETDEALRLKWSVPHRFTRILLSSEVNMKKSLDGNAIKKQSSGGDMITARDLHEKAISYVPHYTIFCLLNDVPTIEPMDKPVESRLEYIRFPYVFVDRPITNEEQDKEEPKIEEEIDEPNVEEIKIKSGDLKSVDKSKIKFKDPKLSTRIHKRAF